MQALNNLLCEYIAIIGGEDFSGVAYGDTEPPADQRDLAWFRTDGGGNPIGWYGWDGAAWIPLPNVVPSGPTSSRPSSPTEGTQYIDTDIDVALMFINGAWTTVSGSPGDIKHVVGSDVAAILTKNPGWAHFDDGIGRVLIGAQADGSDAGTDVGADDVTLNIAHLPAHSHDALVVTGSEADSGDAGNFVVTAASQSIGLRTITDSTTASVGDGDSFSVRQNSRIVVAIYKL